MKVKTLYYFIGLSLITLASCNLPSAAFLVHQEEAEAPSKIEFINRSEKAEYFEWDFGDGSFSTDSNPEHRYTQSGDYTVTLKAIAGTKSRSIEQPISVKPPTDKLVQLETSFGTMIIKLFDETPQHRDNFLKLAEEGYYDSLLFHRVMQGFMIQGGDPNSKGAAEGARLGTGGPGYQVPAEFNEALIHQKGALAAARTGGPSNPEKQSSGSQFYLVQGAPVDENQLKMLERRRGSTYTDEAKVIYADLGGTPFLDMDYTVFGMVVEGLEVIDEIAAVETDGNDRPTADVAMKIIVIK